MVTKPSRVFFALWPDDATAKRLHRLGADAQAVCDGRRMRRDTLHLTLVFIGDVSPARLADLIAVGDRTAPATFALQLDRVGSWRHNGIVWAGMEHCPAPLSDLVDRLDAGLDKAGFAVERRTFTPHVTLLRNTRVPLQPAVVASIEWQVDGFVLLESRRTEAGAQYVPVRQWRVESGDRPNAA